MKYDEIAYGQLSYQLYRLPGSKSWQRGPAPDMAEPYCACIGSTESFGKYIAKPYPQIVQDRLKIPWANYSAVNAGIDRAMKDAAVLSACQGAKLTVVAIVGAHNLSNRLYRVHPRHNDRFVNASPILRKLFPSVDFAEHHYTRHLLQSLHAADADAFTVVIAELQTAWRERMQALLEAINSPVILLWAARQPPPDTIEVQQMGVQSPDPLFVTQPMLDHLSPLVKGVVESLAPPLDPIKEKWISPGERPQAEHLPGPASHAQIAKDLLPYLKKLL